MADARAGDAATTPEQSRLLEDKAETTPHKGEDAPASRAAELGSRRGMAGLSLLGKARYLCGLVTVEPALWLYVVSMTMALLATQNLILEKACRVNLGFNETVCDALSVRDTANFTAEEEQVQQLATRVVGARSLMQSALPALLILFVGSWSDRRGRRKPCMLVPIMGEIINAAGHLVCTYFYLELPVEADLFCEAVFPSVTGGWYILFMAAYTYIADITSEEDRTFRIGFVNMCAFSGVPIGVALSGVLFELIGFYGVFSLSLLMNAASFVAVIFLVKETPKKENVPEGFIGFMRDFFDVRCILDTVGVAFRRGRERCVRVLLLMGIVWLHIGAFAGENTLQYLFLRLRFNWDGLNFSFFSTYIVVVHLIGMALSIAVLTSWLKLHDSLVGMIAATSKMSAAIVYAFAPTVTVLMFAPVADLLKDTVYIALRAISSKVVPNEDLGKTNSLIGVSEAIAPIVCGPLFSAVYAATLDTLPGAFYLVSAGMAAVIVVIFWWFYLMFRREQQRTAATENTKKTAHS